MEEVNMHDKASDFVAPKVNSRKKKLSGDERLHRKWVQHFSFSKCILILLNLLSNNITYKKTRVQSWKE